MGIFWALISGDYFSSFEDPEIYGWVKIKNHLLWLLVVFETGFM